jgi:excisionase family DNA binding protein
VSDTTSAGSDPVVPDPVVPDLSGAGSSASGPGDLDTLVPRWLTLAEVADRLGTDVVKVRQLIRDGGLLAVRRGPDRILSVPETLLDGDAVLRDLRGTLTVLSDAKITDEEAVRWLHIADDLLPGRPVDALRTGRKTEVRRRAQALAW